MGADNLFYVKIIETHARAFLTLNILAIGRVLIHLVKVCGVGEGRCEKLPILRPRCLSTALFCRCEVKATREFISLQLERSKLISKLFGALF